MSKRALMQAVTGEAHAFFAPVARATETPTIFDPSIGGFALDAPTSPWISLGWVKNFQRSSTSAMQALRTGATGVAQTQIRTLSEARVEFDFMEWGKPQMALSAGSQHYNILAPATTGGSASPSGGAPAAAATVQAGSTANSIVLGAATANFKVGDLVAVDVDYASQTGYVGSGVSGAYVGSADAVQRDVNYVRRVTWNVGLITAISATSLMLDAPLVGGAPAAGASAQKVIGFVDRDGPSYVQEWSALFIMEPLSGGRVCLYYPRLQTAGASGERSMQLGELTQTGMHASFISLPFTDPIDGEQVIGYRHYLPASGAPAY